MLDPSLRPRVVEATTPDLIEPLVAELLDALEGRGQAELMSEYFEPVSVLGLGRVLGIPHLDGDTLRRWFHGLAQGAINFEDDPAKWAVSDATGAEIDRELAPVFERALGRAGRQHDLDHAPARGGLARGARRPGAADAQGDPPRRDAGARPRRRDDGRRAAALGSGGAGRRGSGRAARGRGRGGAALGVADRHADPSRARRDRARRGHAPGWREPRRPRLVREPRRGRLGADRRLPST